MCIFENFSVRIQAARISATLNPEFIFDIVSTRQNELNGALLKLSFCLNDAIQLSSFEFFFNQFEKMDQFCPVNARIFLENVVKVFEKAEHSLRVKLQDWCLKGISSTCKNGFGSQPGKIDLFQTQLSKTFHNHFLFSSWSFL